MKKTDTLFHMKMINLNVLCAEFEICFILMQKLALGTQQMLNFCENNVMVNFTLTLPQKFCPFIRCLSGLSSVIQLLHLFV